MNKPWLRAFRRQQKPDEGSPEKSNSAILCRITGTDDDARDFLAIGASTESFDEYGSLAMTNLNNVLIGGVVLGAIALAVMMRFGSIDGGGPPPSEPSGVANSMPTASDAALSRSPKWRAKSGVPSSS